MERAQHEPRRDRALPLVRLEPRDEVVAGLAAGASRAAEAVAAATERDHGRTHARRANGEAGVPSLAHRADLADTGRGHEQIHARVPEPERAQAVQLLREL